MLLKRLILLKPHQYYNTCKAKISNKPKRISTGTLLLWGIPLTTLGLGVWQIKRHKWKTELIRKINQQMKNEPVDFPVQLTDLESMEYRKVKVKGHFEHDREQLVGPRVLLRDEKFHLISASETGYWVVTPFKLADRDYTILVNRGWIPKQKKNPALRSEGQIEGEIELNAVVRKSESSSKNKIIYDRAGFWVRRDIEAIAKAIGTAPVMVDADANSTVPGGPIGGQTRVSMRNEHFNYALTWFAMSFLTAVMCGKQTFPIFFK